MATIASFVAKCNAWAAEVQGIGVIVPPPPVGVRIRVTASAKVRASPDSTFPGMTGSPQPVGALGTVRAGTAQTNGFQLIDFDVNPPHGWVWRDNFAII